MNEENKERFSNVTHYTDVNVQPGGINIQHVENLYQADFLKALGVELEVKKKDTAEKKEEEDSPSSDDKLMNKLDVPVITPLDRIYAGIRYVRESGIVKHDYEYAAIKYRIDSFRLFEKLSNNAFVEMLMASGAFTEEDCPTAGNLKKVQIEGEYPNWRLIGKGCDSLSQLFNVAKKFDEGCKNIR